MLRVYRRMEYDLIDHDALKIVFCHGLNVIGFVYFFYSPLWGTAKSGAVVDLESGL